MTSAQPLQDFNVQLPIIGTITAIIYVAMFNRVESLVSERELEAD